MGTYIKEWECCGSVTHTEGWEPGDCPFCEPAPQPQAQASTRDETPIEIGGESVPRWVVEYADALTEYTAANGGRTWAIGGVQSRELVAAQGAPLRPRPQASEAAPRSRYNELAGLVEDALRGHQPDDPLSEVVGSILEALEDHLAVPQPRASIIPPNFRARLLDTLERADAKSRWEEHNGPELRELAEIVRSFLSAAPQPNAVRPLGADFEDKVQAAYEGFNAASYAWKKSAQDEPRNLYAMREALRPLLAAQQPGTQASSRVDATEENNDG